MGVRRFRFLTSGQREHLHRAFSAVAESWHAEWFGAEAPAPASSAPLDFEQIPNRTVRVYRGQDGAWIGVALPPWAEFRLAAALFGISPDDDFKLGPVSRAVVDEALRDLARVAMQSDVLGESLFSDGPIQSVLPRDAFRRGSSCSGIEFSAGSVPVTLFVGSVVVERELEVVDRPGLGRVTEPIHRALGPRLVPVHVELGSAEIRAEELWSLQIGDVVRINQRIDQPLDILIEGERRLKGFVARAPDGRKCVRLVAAP